MRGNVTKRGRHSWRLKFDLERDGGERRTRTITIRGSRKDAEAKLAELLNDANKGTLIDPSKDGSPISPNSFSVMWGRAVPQATFHSLRHTHASALIAAGQDVVTVSRRLGHAKPTITLNVYLHLFANTDADCADAIEEMLAN